MDFGFILTRHVKCAQTNEYWNRCVSLLRRFYPKRKIIIIDDNSNQEYVKGFREYSNVEIIPSEFPGRGEILPYYYFHKHHFFDVAIILHDSVFFHRRIPFEKFHAIHAVPFWSFDADTENVENSLRLISKMKNQHALVPCLMKDNTTVSSIFSAGPFRSHEFPILGMPKSFSNSEYGAWSGCFGVQSFIRHSFLHVLVEKYDIFQMLPFVKNRNDRCCLERIFGVLFFLELKHKSFSLFGNIRTHNNNFNYTYEKYKEDAFVKKQIPHPVTKIWTGR